MLRVKVRWSGTSKLTLSRLQFHSPGAPQAPRNTPQRSEQPSEGEKKTHLNTLDSSVQPLCRTGLLQAAPLPRPQGLYKSQRSGGQSDLEGHPSPLMGVCSPPRRLQPLPGPRWRPSSKRKGHRATGRHCPSPACCHLGNRAPGTRLQRTGLQSPTEGPFGGWPPTKRLLDVEPQLKMFQARDSARAQRGCCNCVFKLFWLSSPNGGGGPRRVEAGACSEKSCDLCPVYAHRGLNDGHRLPA